MRSRVLYLSIYSNKKWIMFRFKKVFALILVFFGAMVGLFACTPTYDLTLVKDGKAMSTIVIAPDAKPAANFAALELQYFIRKMSGAEVAIVTNPDQAQGVKIFVGESAHTKALGIDPSKYGYTETLITFAEDSIVIVGRDALREDCRVIPTSAHLSRSEVAGDIDYTKANGETGEAKKVFVPGMFDYRGTMRATYRFLEEWTDVRFFGPKPINIHTPVKKSIKVAGSFHHHLAPMLTRSGANGTHGRRNGENEYTGTPSSDESVLYNARIRWGGEPWYINHSFEHLNYKNRFTQPVEPTNKDDQAAMRRYQQHKKDFEKVIVGLKPRGNSHQFCFTSEDVIDQIVQDARDYFDGKLGDNVDGLIRNFQGRNDTFFVVPFDVGGYCKCGTCQKLLAYGKDRSTSDFNNGEASDYIFSLVNTIAKEVAKTHPDKTIGTLAYEQYYWRPVSFEMEKNVSMTPCVHTKAWLSSPDTAHNEQKHYKEWVELAQEGKMRQMGMWTYDFDVPGCATAFYPKERGEFVQMFIKDGVKHTFFCGAPPMLEMYVTNRLFENPTLDPQGLVDDFCEKYFGPAGDDIKEMYRLLTDYTTNPKYRFPGGAHDRITLYSSFLNDEHLMHVRSAMNRAKAKGTAEPYASRLNAWDATFVSFYEKGIKAFHERLAKEAATHAKAYNAVEADYIQGVSAIPCLHWYASARPDVLVNGKTLTEGISHRLGSKNAKNRGQMSNFRWGRVIKAQGGWITFDLGRECDLDEIHFWNYTDQARNTQWGMKDIEMSYAKSTEDMRNGKWVKLPNVTLAQAQKEPKVGADTIVKVDLPKVRYISIHTLGTFGKGNWDINETANTIKVDGEKNTIDDATGMGGTSFADKTFTIGLGAVRFYGKPLQAQKPVSKVIDGKIAFEVPGFPKAVIRYTADNTIPCEESRLYTMPIAVGDSNTIRARAYIDGMQPSEHAFTYIDLKGFVAQNVPARKLTAQELAGVTEAFLKVDMHNIHDGVYQKAFFINGDRIFDLPRTISQDFKTFYVDIPKDAIKKLTLKTVFAVKTVGTSANTSNMRNPAIFVRTKDGTWTRTVEHNKVYHSAKKTDWVNKKGEPLDPMQLKLSFE